jgi:hypothetical protein
MKLSESYTNRIKFLSGIMLENDNLNNYEYQVRNIGGDVFYKRKKGDKKWQFIDEVEFYKNSTKKNLIKWEDKDSKKNKTKEVKSLDYNKNPLEVYKIYFENISPSDFKVEIVDDFIKITKNKL